MSGAGGRTSGDGGCLSGNDEGANAVGPGPVIQVEDLSYAYGDRVAVDGISFEVARGEILGFLGPNGAGKSTTIKMLTGQLTPKAGRAAILGMDVRGDNAAVQAHIGVCFEEKNLYPNMSAKENLVFFSRLFGIKRFNPLPLLERVGLAERAKDRAKDFSKGMKQRLMIARALVNEPSVLFLDEPTDGLDPVSSQAIREVIEEEARRGAAVLLTTHDMLEADALSDRVAFINEGRIAALDTPENLKLQHGRRAVRIRTREYTGDREYAGDRGSTGVREDGGVREEVIGLDEAGAGERIKAAVASEGLMTIHTEEATLEAIFIKLTGRGLEG